MARYDEEYFKKQFEGLSPKAMAIIALRAAMLATATELKHHEGVQTIIPTIVFHGDVTRWSSHAKLRRKCQFESIGVPRCFSRLPCRGSADSLAGFGPRSTSRAPWPVRSPRPCSFE